MNKKYIFKRTQNEEREREGGERTCVLEGLLFNPFLVLYICHYFIVQELNFLIITVTLIQHVMAVILSDLLLGLPAWVALQVGSSLVVILLVSLFVCVCVEKVIWN